MSLRAKLLKIRKGNRRRFTDDEDRTICARYPHERTDKIATDFRRTVDAVYRRAFLLGVKKTREYLNSPDACRLRRGEHVGMGFWFQKGHVPANKGLCRPGYAPGRMKETQFKKGQNPRNTYPVGTVLPNADGYLRIKISDAPQPPGMGGGKSPNWQFVHRRVWEAAHGPVPKAHRIWWKDGNHANCLLGNLELVSDEREDRAEAQNHNAGEKVSWRKTRWAT